MRNVKIFLGIAAISVLCVNAGPMEGREAEIARLNELKTSKLLPNPNVKPEIKLEPSEKPSEPTLPPRPAYPAPKPPRPAYLPAPVRPEPVREESVGKEAVGENPFATPLTEAEAKAADEGQDNPFAEFTSKPKSLAAPTDIKLEPAQPSDATVPETKPATQEAPPLPPRPEGTEALKTPETKLKEAQNIIKKANKAIGNAAKTFKTTVQSIFKNLDKTITGAPKKIQAAVTKFNSDLLAKVTKFESSGGKSLDEAIKDFDTFIKKPFEKELSSASKEIEKGINRVIAEARKFIGIAKTQNEQRQKATEDANYIKMSKEAAQKTATEKGTAIKDAQALLGVKPDATNDEIAKAFRLAAVKANRIQDPTARAAAISELSTAKLTLEKKEANLFSGAGSATGQETGDIKEPTGNPTKEETSKPQATPLAPSLLLE